jgi:hypothetical protein
MTETHEQQAREGAQALIRFNALMLGLTVGFIGAVALFVLTLGLTFRGGEDIGSFLGQLHYFFPGYTVSIGGALFGAFWAGLLGFGIGTVMGLAYGPWLMSGAVSEMRRSIAGEDESDRLDDSVVLLEPLRFAAVSGALLALGLFLGTNWLWFTTGEFSPHLFLLHNYLPGFTPNFVGSLFGAFWLFIYGFVAAGSVASVYDLVVRRRLIPPA